MRLLLEGSEGPSAHTYLDVGSAFPTSFGWILIGNKSGIHVNSAVVKFINLEQNFMPTEADLRRL
jgi:hypothetical protein